MTLYAILPTLNLDDPEQCSTDLDKIKRLAAEFVSKYSQDCKEVAIVEIKEVGRMQYCSPIFVETQPPVPVTEPQRKAV